MGLLLDRLIIVGEVGMKQSYFRNKIEEYMDRGEEIKRKVQKLKDDGKYHEQISISSNSTGYGYETVLGRFLDDEVVEVEVQDPYIRIHHQCQNFLRLCELLVKKCSELKRIKLVTGRDGQNGGVDQEKWLNVMKTDLLRFNVQLVVEYSPTLHDRQIV